MPSCPSKESTKRRRRSCYTLRFRAGDCFVPPGEDVAAGEIVLRAGRRLGGPELGVLATLGIARVPSTVDRFSGLFRPATSWSMRPSRSRSATCAIRTDTQSARRSRRSARLALQLPRVVDDPNALRKALAAALERCDGIVLTGGSSVGERDHTPQIVAELGAPGPIVHGLRVKPGKPTLLAAVGSKPIIGLPGNPRVLPDDFGSDRAPHRGGLHGTACVASGRAGSGCRSAVRRTRGMDVVRPGAAARRGRKTLCGTGPDSLVTYVVCSREPAGTPSIGEWPARIEAGATVLISLFASGGAPVEAA
jgi:hypothetical protein